MQNSGPNPANDYLVLRLVTAGDTFFEVIRYLGFWEMKVLTDAEKKYPALVDKLRSDRTIEILWKGYLQALHQMDSNVPLEPPKDVQDQDKGRWYVDTVMQAAFAIYHQQRKEIAYLINYHPDEEMWAQIDALKVNKRNFNIGKLIARHRQLNAFNEALIRNRLFQQFARLDLSFLRITRFPDELLEDNELVYFWDTLKTLNCNFNYLRKLPDKLGQLKALKELDCSHSKLEQLPYSIGDLGASLKILSCASNNLRYLPDSIGNLRELRIMNLQDNQLDTLPDTVKHLDALQVLNCTWNNIHHLPDFLRYKLGKQWHLNTLSVQRSTHTPVFAHSVIPVIVLTEEEIDATHTTALNQLSDDFSRVNCKPK